MPAEAPARPAAPAETPARPVAARGPGLDQPVKPGAALALRKEPAPKPPTATPQEQLEQFAKDLRDLRTQAGLGYPEMAELSHYTMKTLASAAGGLSLPTLPVTMAYVRACEGSVPEWEDRWHRLADAMKPAAEDAEAAAGPDGVRPRDGARESDGNPRDGRDTGAGRDRPRGRDRRDESGFRDQRGPRDRQGSWDSGDVSRRRDGLGLQDLSGAPGGNGAQDWRNPGDRWDPRDAGAPRDRRDTHAPRDGRDTHAPRDGRDTHAPRDGRDAHAPRDGRDGGGREPGGRTAARPSQVSTPPSAPSGRPGTQAAQQAPPGAPEQVYVITSAAPRRPSR